MAPSADIGKSALARFLLQFALGVEAEVQLAAEASPLNPPPKIECVCRPFFVLWWRNETR